MGGNGFAVCRGAKVWQQRLARFAVCRGLAKPKRLAVRGHVRFFVVDVCAVFARVRRAGGPGALLHDEPRAWDQDSSSVAVDGSWNLNWDGWRLRSFAGSRFFCCDLIRRAHYRPTGDDPRSKC